MHVGSVTNQGTYALIKSEISELKNIYNDVDITVSCADPGALKSREPTLQIIPPLVDISYMRADAKARTKNYSRRSWRYKLQVFYHTLLMLLQAFLLLISIILLKVGLKPIYRSEVIDRLKKADIVISTSDESFKEGASNLPFNLIWKFTWWIMLFSRMIDVIVAKKIFKKPIIIFPSSIGPFRTRIGRFFSKTVFNNVDLILLREKRSIKFVESIETPVTMAADTALLCEFPHNKIYNRLQKDTIAVSPGFYDYSLSTNTQNQYFLAHAKALDLFIEKYGSNVIFLPHDVKGFKHDDLKACERIIENMKRKDKTKIILVKTLEEFKHFLGQIDLLIASKMHPSVLASTNFTPMIAIVYDHKQTGFFEQIGLDEYIIDINKLSNEELLSKMENAWVNRMKIEKQLSQKIPALQELVRMKMRESLSKFY